MDSKKISDRIEKGLKALKKAPKILRHGIIGNDVLILRVRDNVLQAALVPAKSLRSVNSGAGLDQDLIKAHSSYVSVSGDWSAGNVLSSVGLNPNHLEVRDEVVH